MLLNLLLYILGYSFLCGIFLGILTKVRGFDRITVLVATLWPMGVPAYIGWLIATILIYLFNSEL